MVSKHRSRDADNFITVYCYHWSILLLAIVILSNLQINYYMYSTYVYTGKDWLGATQGFKKGVLKVSLVDKIDYCANVGQSPTLIRKYMLTTI